MTAVRTYSHTLSPGEAANPVHTMFLHLNKGRFRGITNSRDGIDGRDGRSSGG